MSTTSDDAPLAEAGATRDGRRARWAEHNRTRRRLILDAALEVAEDHAPGATVTLDQIAVRAGLRRPAVYRYFADRRELEVAMQVEVAHRLAREILLELDTAKTLITLIRDAIGVYVGWAEAHPSLLRIIDSGARLSDGPVQRGISEIAQEVTHIVHGALDDYGVQVSPAERATVDPLVHGLVEAVVGTVRRWVAQTTPPPRELLVHLASESVWFIMAGHAEVLGIPLERDTRLAELAGAASDETTDQTTPHRHPAGGGPDERDTA